MRKLLFGPAAVALMLGAAGLIPHAPTAPADVTSAARSTAGPGQSGAPERTAQPETKAIPRSPGGPAPWRFHAPGLPRSKKPPFRKAQDERTARRKAGAKARRRRMKAA